MAGVTEQRPEDQYSAREREQGRRMFACPWHFGLSVPAEANLPPPFDIEIAFAGRSNVGKSSLINALTGQKGLARTSNTPGRTQALNFFYAEQPGGGAGPLTLVDMPGYGYAEAPKAMVAAWTALVFDYLKGRTTLARVYLLIDARHGIKTSDIEVMDLLDRAAVSYQLVLTKADKIKPPAQARLIVEIRQSLCKRPAAFPDVLLTSSAKGTGIAEIQAAIYRLMVERGVIDR